MHFLMKQVTNPNGKNTETNKELYAPNAAVKNIIGKKTKKIMNVNNADIAKVFSNTVMHGSQLPYRYWFIATHLLTSTKKIVSASELQRQLGHSTYHPIWALIHKLRMAMGRRDSKYSLEEVMELDEGFFTTETDENEKDNPLKRGRGSQRKTKVLVMVESKPVEGEMTKKGKPRKVGHMKMFIIEDLKAETINSKVSVNIGKNSIIDSDHSTSYTNFHTLVKEHRPKVIPKNEVGKMLLWVHMAISNAKRMLLEIFHDIQSEYLQSYLKEFCYKFNRIYFGEKRFDRLMIATVNYKNQFRYNIK